MNSNEIIRRIYRGATEWPLAQFQRAAFGALSELISFDSGVWCRSAESPETIVDMFLDLQSKQRINGDLARFQKKDFAAIMRRHPRKTVNLVDMVSREDTETCKIYSEFLRYWGVRQVLSSCWVEPMSGIKGVLSLWRKSPRRPFTELERSELELLIPHLTEAHRTCRIAQMLKIGRVEQGAGQALAICNPRGMLIEAEAAFTALIFREWNAWHGSILPKELQLTLTQKKVYRGTLVVVTAQPLDDMLLVRIRAISVLDKMSKKQWQIAHHYIRGESHCEIAKSFGLAENTVRNHIANIYKICRVHNKSELAVLVLQHKPLTNTE